MPTIKRTVLERASQVWREAADRLNFKVVAPFTLTSGEYSGIYIAFLPNFGSPQGMVVAPMMPPSFHTDPLLKKLAEEKRFFYSFVNAAAWDTFDEAAVKDALIDWGFFGPNDERPVWLPQPGTGHVGE